MRRFLFVVSAVAACGFVACDKRPAAADATEEHKRQEQREADERRIAELKELEQRAADREAEAAAAELDKQRQALETERVKLERDRADLNEEQRRVADARLEKIREEEVAADRREEVRRAEQRKRDQQLAEERPGNQRAEQNLDFFYDALDPEGDWVEVERYGYCWQPRVAREGSWRPYVDGHWAYTNYGWTWVSNEPFGWATYHYGRWTRVRGLGWVWVPGSEWAPAWVSWRRSDRHIGWAPLPPEAHSRSGFTAGVDSRYDIGPGLYNFVEVEKFGEPTYVRQVVAPELNITVLRQTVNVTNVTYQNVDNRVVVFNEGPRFAEVNQHAKVRRMNVERVAQGSARSEEQGDTLRLLAPVVAPAATETRQPKRVRENVKAPVMERGWSGAPAAVVAEVREQQKEEARKSGQTPPATRTGAVPPTKAEPPKTPAVAPGSSESKDPKATAQPGEPGRAPKGPRPTEAPTGASTAEPSRKPPVIPPVPDSTTAKPPTSTDRPAPRPAPDIDTAKPPVAKPEAPAPEGEKPVRKPGENPAAVKPPRLQPPQPAPGAPPRVAPPKRENDAPANPAQPSAIAPTAPPSRRGSDATAPKPANELKPFRPDHPAPEKKPAPPASAPSETAPQADPAKAAAPSDFPKQKPGAGMRPPGPREAPPAPPAQAAGTDALTPAGATSVGDDESKAKKAKADGHPQPSGLRKKQPAAE